MVTNKSLDEYSIIAALLSDFQQLHSEVLTPRLTRLTIQKIGQRVKREGRSFLTKTLPRLGKALDRALTGDVSLDATSLAFKPLKGSQLPMLFGELFSRVFTHNGWVLPNPCVASIRSLRQILYLFYKYELPYSPDLEQEVLSQFLKTEEEIRPYSQKFEEISNSFDARVVTSGLTPEVHNIIRIARINLQRLFSNFDGRDIYPTHGPGAVATRQKLWEKWIWTEISPRILDSYPLDEYFFVSLTHVVDRLDYLQGIRLKENSARVILVPKDSRGPRLISCEPVDFQWIQQGLSRAIVRHVEQSPITRYSVRFTDQQPNRIAALYGSQQGRYSTLDLKEASDRVTVGHVRLLFPEPLQKQLLDCRSLSTGMPGGNVVILNKYAPMGSALCFPILALTVWSLLIAGTLDADTREGIYVYGDDVIVPTAYAARAISILECFGLKVNSDKSCTNGLFRESCGLDAFSGIDVTPVRFRTVWASTPSPSVYCSWISYANSCYDRRYFSVYDEIVRRLHSVYGEIPSCDMHLACPSLREVEVARLPKSKRFNRALQKVQYRVYDVKQRPIKHEIDGWSMLLRYFCEGHNQTSRVETNEPCRCGPTDILSDENPFTASMYTKRNASMLVRLWR